MIRPASLVLALASTIPTMIGCAGAVEDESGPRDEAAASPDPNSPQPPATEAPSFADYYKPVVLLFQGGANDVIVDQGFELVVGATHADLERVDTIVVDLPGELGSRTLLPSGELTGMPDTPPAFFGYYGTAEGLPPDGDYRFRFTMIDDATHELTRAVAIDPIDIPRQVSVSRQDDAIEVSWLAVAGARNYSVAVFTSDASGATLADTGTGCESGLTSTPPSGEKSVPLPSCTVTETAALQEDGWYVISVGAWGWEEPEGVSSYAGAHAAPFVW